MPVKSHVSFEFFPPKTEEAEIKLWSVVEQLDPLKPDFVSVTYGAGGTTRERTHHIVKRIHDETSLKPAAHLTCVGASRAQIDQVLRDYWQAGIRHIVALRGDPPQGSGKYVPHPEGYTYASDLIHGARAIGDFEISVAAFPEKHPESKSFEEDIEVLKGKVAAGATRAITQYFFDTDLYLRLRDRIRKARLDIPVVPGLIPIGHFGQLKKFSAMCGASIPAWVADQFERLDDKHAERDHAAIELVTRQYEKLRMEGVEQFHFYTLNRADLTLAICRHMGIAGN